MNNDITKLFVIQVLSFFGFLLGCILIASIATQSKPEASSRHNPRSLLNLEQMARSNSLVTPPLAIDPLSVESSL
jgi:hypothetical protein